MAQDTRSTSAQRHPIQVVARRTGLSQDLLRAWEKRYSVVAPTRSPSGRRLYSDDDIERLRLLRRAVAAGRRISDIAALSNSQLAEMVKEDQRQEAERVDEAREVAAPDVLLGASLAAVEALDAGELESVLRRASVTLGVAEFIEAVAAPLLDYIGRNWSEGVIHPGHEHLASAVLQRVLGNMIEATLPSEPTANLVVATPVKHEHVFGALFVAATAAAEGWGVSYLGRDLPAGDIAAVARDTKSRAVALSLVYPPADGGVSRELQQLRKELSSEVPLLVGGAAASSYQKTLRAIGAIQLAGMAELRTALAELC